MAGDSSCDVDLPRKTGIACRKAGRQAPERRPVVLLRVIKRHGLQDFARMDKPSTRSRIQTYDLPDTDI